jgi:hypothetical protein
MTAKPQGNVFAHELLRFGDYPNKWSPSIHNSAMREAVGELKILLALTQNLVFCDFLFP